MLARIEIYGGEDETELVTSCVINEDDYWFPVVRLVCMKRQEPRPYDSTLDMEAEDNLSAACDEWEGE